MHRFHLQQLYAALLCSAGSVAQADVIIPGNMAGAPAWSPAANVTVNLAQAIEGPWDSTPPNANPLIGIYDPNVWAVVFKFSSVNIPSNVTVTFNNHPSNPPVVWLVDGPVTINGVVSLNGAAGHDWNQVGLLATPGPGGFRGGRASEVGWTSAGGFGPGAGRPASSTACWSGPGAGYGQSGTGGWANGNGGIAYGSAAVLPLVGGSGGCGGNAILNPDDSSGGGAGGGAILIASRTTMTLGTGLGRIRSVGGNGGNGTNGSQCNAGQWTIGGGGSGGAVRLIADTVIGTGAVDVRGGKQDIGGGTDIGRGGIGRVRIESNSSTIPVGPGYTYGAPGTTARLFPDSTTPIVTDVFVAGMPVPQDPEARISFPGADVAIPSGGPVEVEVHAIMVPTNSTMQVITLPSSGTGQRFITNLTFQSGDAGASVWRGNVSIPGGISAMQVRAVIP